MPHTLFGIKKKVLNMWYRVGLEATLTWMSVENFLTAFRIDMSNSPSFAGIAHVYYWRSSLHVNVTLSFYLLRSEWCFTAQHRLGFHNHDSFWPCIVFFFVTRWCQDGISRWTAWHNLIWSDDALSETYIGTCSTEMPLCSFTENILTRWNRAFSQKRKGKNRK